MWIEDISSIAVPQTAAIGAERKLRLEIARFRFCPEADSRYLDISSSNGASGVGLLIMCGTRE